MPGFFGSLAAAPQTPGFSFAAIYYHTSVNAGADVAFARQVSRGNITVPFTANVDINLKARADLGFVIPSYVFTEKIFGAQARSTCWSRTAATASKSMERSPPRSARSASRWAAAEPTR